MSIASRDEGDGTSRLESNRRVARVYDRIAGFYDLVDAPMERLGGRTRRLRMVEGARGRVLEVGVGTGANLEHYRPHVDLMGPDIAEGMLARARGRADRLGRNVALDFADVQELPFDDATFNTVVANCVFCTVADPVAGLHEVARGRDRNREPAFMIGSRPFHTAGCLLGVSGNVGSGEDPDPERKCRMSTRSFRT